MKRMHIHLSVSDLDSNIKFYNTMFGIEPTILESDYAKWRLENPSVNFAISNKGRENGLNHLGLELDSDEELNKVHKRIEKTTLSRLRKKGRIAAILSLTSIGYLTHRVFLGRTSIH